MNGWVPLVALACWPSWPYLLARWQDGSDEPLGVLAAALLLWLGWPRGLVYSVTPALPLAGMLLYGALSGWAPPLVSAAVALLTLAALACQARHGRVLAGWLALALLSLPSLASLQFYLGYPARVAAAQGARTLLGLQGFALERQGVQLSWGSRQLLVDTPCSGLSMLWMTLFLAAALAARRCWGWRATAGMLALAGAAAWGANLLRLTGLFYTELLLARPELHEAVGVAAFGLGAALVLGCSPACRDSVREPGPGRNGGVRWGLVLATGVALSGLTPGRAVYQAIPPFPGWPHAWQGQALEFVEEVPWAGFPGRIGRFRSGSEVLLLRWVSRPTRLLHSSRDCLRARGLTSLEVAGGFRGGGWEGSETIHDAQGRVFTDVSQWYWAAAWGGSPGPWWAVTRLTSTPTEPLRTGPNG